MNEGECDQCFSHRYEDELKSGLCPDCYKGMIPELEEDMNITQTPQSVQSEAIQRHLREANNDWVKSRKSDGQHDKDRFDRTPTTLPELMVHVSITGVAIWGLCVLFSLHPFS